LGKLKTEIRDGIFPPLDLLETLERIGKRTQVKKLLILMRPEVSIWIYIGWNGR
jgi:hypothetical protein